MDKKKDLRFWLFQYKVLAKAINNTSALYRQDKRIWLSNVVSAGIALFVLYRLGGVSVMSNELMVTISGLVGTISGFVFVFLCNLIIAPVKLFREKEIEASKFTWNDVSITIATLPKDDPHGVCLSVVNNKPYDIQKASAKITYIQQGRYIRHQENLPKSLCWIANRGRIWGGKKLERNGGSRLISIGNWNTLSTSAWLETGIAKETGVGEEELIPLEMNVNYKVEIQWFGWVDGRGLDEHKTEYWLKYTGDHIELKDAK